MIWPALFWYWRVQGWDAEYDTEGRGRLREFEWRQRSTVQRIALLWSQINRKWTDTKQRKIHGNKKEKPKTSYPSRGKRPFAAENVLIVTAVCWEWDNVSSVSFIILYQGLHLDRYLFLSSPLLLFLHCMDSILFFIVPFTAVRELCVCVCAGEASI